MKLKEVVQLMEFTPSKMLWHYELDGTQLVLKTDKTLNPEDEVEVDYYWYDHLYRDSLPIVHEIDNLIKENKWTEFCEVQEKYGKKLTLPDEASIWVNGECIGDLYLTYNTFPLITHSEYECG